MKRNGRYILAAAMLVAWFINCSVHPEPGAPSLSDPAFPSAATLESIEELSPREELLCTSLWGASRELRFAPDRSGALLAQPFSWRLSGDRLNMSFFPGSSVGRTMELKLTQPGSRAELKGEGLRFRMDFLLTPSNKQARQQQRRAAELAAQRALGEEIAQSALSFVGYDYKYGGKSPETGFDCSGLVYYLYAQRGYTLQRVSDEQAKQGRHIEPEELLPGDLLAFYTSGKYVGHVGIYVGYGYYVHAMGEAYGVVLTALDDPYLTRSFEARRLIGCPELLASDQPDA